MGHSPNIPAAAPDDSSTTELRIRGMTCQNCARHVAEAIQNTPGVRHAVVSIGKNTAAVHWKPGTLKNNAAIIAAVQKAGYEAEPLVSGAGESSAPGQADWQIRLGFGLAATVTLMIGEWILGLAMTPWFQWLAFALGGVVQLFCGAPFYHGAWRQLKAGHSNMDTLVALGSSTAFGFSGWVLFSGAGGHVYFMEAASILSLISAGHWLEARASDQAGGALKSLLNLAPQTARRIVSFRGHRPVEGHSLLRDGIQSLLAPATATEEEVPVAQLKTGDCIALRPGDRVPMDGVVLEGEAAVNESMLTGESIPADKKPGSDLFAGTINLNGRLILRVTATGDSTALAHIIAAVQRAQTSRAHLQRLGDRVSSVFVPAIVAVAGVAGLAWSLAPETMKRLHDSLAPFLWHTPLPIGSAASFIIATAVLIIACPCAMGLATPAAIMASANAAARRGILIRDGVALEKAGTVTAVIFDKTGTLTSGKPEVADSWSSRSRQEEELTNMVACEEKIIAASLARHSAHPISRAIAELSLNPPEVSNWKEIPGAGVEGRLSARLVRLGSLDWLKNSGVDLEPGEKFIAQWSGQGATVAGLASEQNLLGLFAVRDALKANARSVVEELQRQGLKIYLLTGDHALTAASIATEVGIAAENVFAGVRPEQKAEFVKQLQAQGQRVAFVGDGINDGPALTQADLGIAVSRASDVAREAADILLLKSGIEAVPEALGLAQATLRTIRQNLFWAFFYNALGVPLAAMGFISPVFCAAAMGLSDLIVIGNALRLLRWRRP